MLYVKYLRFTGGGDTGAHVSSQAITVNRHYVQYVDSFCIKIE